MSTLPERATARADYQVGFIDADAPKTRTTSLENLETIAQRIRNSVELKHSTETAREHYQEGREKAYSQSKLELPCILPAAAPPPRTSLRNLPARHHNGLYGFDIDKNPGQWSLKEAKDTITRWGPAALVFTSVSGAGLAAVIAGPQACNIKDYRNYWKAIAESFPNSVRNCVDRNQHNLNRLRFLSHDTDCFSTNIITPLTPEAISTLAPSAGARSPQHSPAGEWPLALEWLAQQGYGGEDNIRQAVGHCLKGLNHSYQDWAAWCQQGGSKNPAHFAVDRWNSFLPSTEPEDEIYRTAYARGWRRSQGTPPTGRSATAASPLRPPEQRPAQTKRASTGWLAAQGLAPRMRQHFRFDEQEESGWWRYRPQSGAWRNASHSELYLTDWLHQHRLDAAQELKNQGQEEAAGLLSLPDKPFETHLSAKSAFLSALRTLLSGPKPAGPKHLLNTPSGTVNLRSGTLLPHRPEHECRATTAGRYTNDPQELRELNRILSTWLEPVLNPENYRMFLQLAGLGLTGNAQAHRSIVLLLGPEGSGKGGLTNLLINAAGEYAFPLSSGYFEKAYTDIDAIGAEIIEKQTRITTCEEVAGIRKHDRILEITGDVTQITRRPHGRLIPGKTSFQLWLTAISPPREFDAESGIRRRLAVIVTQGLLTEKNRKPDYAAPKELPTALISLAAQEAKLTYQESYSAPSGAEGVKAAVLDIMDPMRAWLNELDPRQWEGRTLQEALEASRQEFPDNQLQKLAHKIAGTKWRTVRTMKAGIRSTCLQLKEST